MNELSRIPRRSFVTLLAGGAATTALAGWPAFALADRYLIELNARPLDLETPLDYLGDSWITPNNMFFVRSHMGPPPTSDVSAWRLAVAGDVKEPLSLSLADLRREFEEVSVTCVLQCAGNGRSLYTPHVAGAQWKYGAVGNARWTGVRLADILRKARPSRRAIFLVNSGKDNPVLATTPKFVRGFPIAKALDPNTLVAYAMNGEPLPMLHGAPLRLVAPGWAGDHWVKWLAAIDVRSQGTEDDAGFWTAVAYRYPDVPGEPGVAVPPNKSHPLTAINVKSIITSPRDGAKVRADSVLTIRGVAYSDTPTINGVEVSVDRGPWSPAKLSLESAPYAWRLWSYAFSPQAGKHTIAARATDGSGAVQPDQAAWNPAGYVYNAIMQVTVEATK